MKMLAVLIALVLSAAGCATHAVEPIDAQSDAHSALERAQRANWFIRIITDSITVEGRNPRISGDTVRIADRKAAIGDIVRVERRRPVGDTGFRAGAVVGGLGGLLFSFVLREAVEYLGESECDLQCSIGVHLFTPGVFTLIGAMIGDAVKQNQYQWDPIWHAVDP